MRGSARSPSRICVQFVNNYDSVPDRIYRLAVLLAALFLCLQCHALDAAFAFQLYQNISTIAGNDVEPFSIEGCDTRQSRIM